MLRKVLMLVVMVSSLVGLVMAQQVDRFAEVTTVRTLEGHLGGVSSIAFSPDGRIVAIGSIDGAARLWRVSNGELIHVLEGHKGGVSQVVFSSDSTKLATSSFYNYSTFIWDIEKGSKIKEIQQYFNRNGSEIDSLSRIILFNSSDQSIFFVSSKSLVRLDIENGNSGKILGLLGREVFVNNEKKSIVEHKDYLAIFRNLNKNCSQELETELLFVTDGDVNNDCKLGLFSSINSVYIFDLVNKKQVNLLSRHTKQVIFSRFSYNGAFIISAAIDKTIRIWKTLTGEQLLKIQFDTENITAFSFSSDGRYFATGRRDGTVQIWGLKDGARIFGASPEWIEKYDPKTDLTTTPVANVPTASAVTESDSKPTTSSTPPRMPVISSAPRTNVRALVIGIGTYGEDRIPKLEYAESDARKFEAALKDPKVGNISGENVTSLIGSQATKTRIEARVKSLAGQTLSGETLIVYFSGHGTPSAKGEPWLVPWDADPNDLPSSVIGLRDLQSTRTAGGNLVLILDSCFSGDAKGKSFAAPGAKPFGIVVKAPTVTGNVSVLSASGSDQSSFEGSSVGGSYLTHFLIEGMNDGVADQNGDGVVSLEEAFKYAKPKVEATARARNAAKQTPQLTGSGDVTLAVNVKAVSDARAGKLSALLAADKISPVQFEKLLEQVNSGQEAPTLKSFLDGSIGEATFLAALKNGGIPGVPKR